MLAVGGNQTGSSADPVHEAELYDPASGTWTRQPASDPTQHRTYHSTAMLLPDGRVISAGANNYRTGQIFRPAYMDVGVPRPVILDAPG